MRSAYQEAGPSPPRRQLKFRWLKGAWAICRLPPDAPAPGWAQQGTFSSITRTTEELSIVCPAEHVPAELKGEVNWFCLKLEGPFPFTQTGVLSSFIDPLGERGIPIFAVSTYDTDYVLIREEFCGATLDALREAGHELISG